MPPRKTVFQDPGSSRTLSQREQTPQPAPTHTAAAPASKNARPRTAATTLGSVPEHPKGRLTQTPQPAPHEQGEQHAPPSAPTASTVAAPSRNARRAAARRAAAGDAPTAAAPRESGGSIPPHAVTASASAATPAPPLQSFATAAAAATAERRVDPLAAVEHSLNALEQKKQTLEGEIQNLSDELTRATANIRVAERDVAKVRLIVAACEDHRCGTTQQVDGLKKVLAPFFYSKRDLTTMVAEARHKAQLGTTTFEAANDELNKVQATLTEIEIKTERTKRKADLTDLKAELKVINAELAQLQEKGRAELFGLFERMIGKPRKIDSFLTDTTAVFSGRDRTKNLERMYKSIVAAQKAKTKERQPFHVIIGSPRMGKSRFAEGLFQLITSPQCAAEGGKRLFAIRITFNNKTDLNAAVRSPRDAEIEIFSRVLHTLCQEFLSEEDVEYGLCKHLAPFVTWRDIREQVQRLVGEPVQIVLIADEFSKLQDRFTGEEQKEFVSMVTAGVYTGWGGSLVVTGFRVDSSTPLLSSRSGRPTNTYFMGAITAATASSYDTLRAAAKLCCTPQLYDLIRFVPGLLGLAVEMYGEMKDEKMPVAELNAPILGAIMRSDDILLPYLTHIVRGRTTDGRRRIETSPCGTKPENLRVMEKLDQAGALLQYRGRSATFGVLNPLYAYESVARMLDNMSAPGNAPSSTAADAPVDAALHTVWTDLTMARDTWLNGDMSKKHVRRAKGACLELLLLFCLMLRARLTQPDSWTVEAYVTCLAGKPLIASESTTSPASTHLLLSLWNGDAAPLSFPCHNSGADFRKRRPGHAHSRTKRRVNKERRVDRLQLSDGMVGTFRPTSQFNGGCDVVQLGTMTLPRGTATPDGWSPGFVMMFETKFYKKPKDFQQAMAAKAAACAIGLMANYRGKFGRAVFVFLTTQKTAWNGNALRRKRFSLRSEGTTGVFDAEVNAVNDELRKREAAELLPDPANDEYTLDLVLEAMSVVDPGCAFSVHAVACGDAECDASPELDACLLETFTYLLPQFSL